MALKWTSQQVLALIERCPLWKMLINCGPFAATLEWLGFRGFAKKLDAVLTVNRLNYNLIQSAPNLKEIAGALAFKYHGWEQELESDLAAIKAKCERWEGEIDDDYLGLVNAIGDVYGGASDGESV